MDLVFLVSICRTLSRVTAFRCLLASRKLVVEAKMSHGSYEIQTDILWLSILRATLVKLGANFQD